MNWAQNGPQLDSVADNNESVKLAISAQTDLSLKRYLNTSLIWNSLHRESTFTPLLAQQPAPDFSAPTLIIPNRKLPIRIKKTKIRIWDVEIHVRHRQHILQEIILYHVRTAAVVRLVRRVDALEGAVLVVDEEGGNVEFGDVH